MLMGTRWRRWRNSEFKVKPAAKGRQSAGRQTREVRNAADCFGGGKGQMGWSRGPARSHAHRHPQPWLGTSSLRRPERWTARPFRARYHQRHPRFAERSLKAPKAVVRSEWGPTPLFIAPTQLKPFITPELLDGPLSPIPYREGDGIAVGYDPTVLRAVCEIWLRAREERALQNQQLDKAQKAELLIRALADIALIALVDEATGYQRYRAKE